jgi:hypothetical protein
MMTTAGVLSASISSTVTVSCEPVGELAFSENLGDKPGRNERPDAVQVGQGGVGGGDQFADLRVDQLCDFCHAKAALALSRTIRAFSWSRG